MKRGKRLLLSCFIFIAGIILNIHLAEGYAPPVESLRRVEPTIGWANVYLGGVKIGFSNCYNKETEYDGKAASRITYELIGRWEGKTTEALTKMTLDKDGRLLSYLSKTVEDGEEGLVEVNFRRGTAYISITSEGVITKQERPLPPETIAEYAVVDKMVQEGLSLGRKFSFPVFSFIHLQPAILTLEVSKKGMVNIDGQEKEIFIVEERWNLNPESITELWIDALGNIYKTEIKDLNLTFVSVSKKAAKDWKSRENIKLSLPRIQANIFIPEANATEYLLAQISKNADDESPLETLSIEVKRDRLIKVPSVSLPIREYPKFRQATAYASIDKDVAKVAEEIISGEKDAYLAARKISLWISDNIRKKEPDGFFTTAIASLASREGDSTDQAILFAALARSVGIPTRLSGGLAGEGSTFSYHVWNEIYLGRWISIDPFLNQFPVDATHVKLSGDKGDEGFFREISLAREQDFPRMRIEILKLKCAGYEFDPTTILSLNSEEENPAFVEEGLIRIGLIYFANETKGEDLKNIHIGINHLLRRDLFCVRSLAVFGETATPSSEQISYFTPQLLSAWAKKMGADKLIIGKVREEGDDLLILAEVFDKEKGEITHQLFSRGKKEEVCKLEKDLFYKIVRALSLQVSPEERERIERGPKTSLDGLLNYSNAWLSRYLIYLSGGRSAYELPRANRYFSLAYRLLGDEKSGREAIALYNTALLLDPFDSETYWQLNLEYKREKKYSEGVKVCKKALAISPNYGSAHLSLGSRYYNLKKYEESLKESRIAIKLLPQNALAYYNYGIDLRKAERYDEAVSALKKSIELNPDYLDAYIVLGRVYHDQKRYNDELEIYTKAILIDPEYYDAHYDIAYTYEALGKTDLAIQQLRYAARRKPKDDRVYYGLGSIYDDKGMYEKAIGNYEKATELDPDYAPYYVGLGVTYDKMGRYDVAIGEYQKALQLNPDDAMAHRNLGLVYTHKGLDDLAISAYKKALELDPNYAPAHYSLANSYKRKKMYDAAISEYKKAIASDPTYAKAHYNLAGCYERKTIYDAAISEYKKAVESNPTYKKAYYSLGTLYYKLNRSEEAEDIARKALETNPQFINAYLLLGSIYYFKYGEADKAIVEYEKVLEIDPKDPYALTNIGIVYDKKGEKEKAIAYYKKAVEAHPNHWLGKVAKKNLEKLIQKDQGE